MTVRQRLQRLSAAVLTIDHRHFDRAFTVLLLAVIGVLLADTLQYRSDSQLFPLVIGVPTFLLLAFLLAVQLVPRLRRLVERYAAADVFDLDDVVSDLDDAPESGGQVERPLSQERRSVIAVSLWTLALFVVVVLVGFLPGTLAFLLVYYRYQADQSWARTVLYSGLMWGFVIVIFEIVLNTPFYTGVFEVELPLPF